MSDSKSAVQHIASALLTLASSRSGWPHVRVRKAGSLRLCCLKNKDGRKTVLSDIKKHSLVVSAVVCFSRQCTRDRDVSTSAWRPYEGKVERLAIRRVLSCKRSTVSSVKQRRQARYPGTLHVASAYPWLNITFVMLYEPLAGGC